jgi:subtilisin family serine protease
MSFGLLQARHLSRSVAAVAALVLLAGLTGAPAAARTPNDPGWRDAWGARLVRLPAVWDVDRGSPDIVIATIDTGAYPVPDLSDALVPGRDLIENDDVARDLNGHGTAVASIIAARANDGVGVAGVCWSCRVMPIRVAADHKATPELIAQGIRWAVDHGARIVNVSLTGGGSPNPLEAAAVEYAVTHDVLIVASAGNTGTEELQYPAALPSVLAVAGTTSTDTLYPWSTRGSWVKLAAPGCQVVDAIPVGWGTLCGSSVAPAVVAGIAGLMLSLDEHLTADDLAAALESSAVPVDGIAGGRIDAYGALAALGLVPPQPVEPYTQQTQVESGLLEHRREVVLMLGAGAFQAEFTSALARSCSMTLIGGRTATTVLWGGRRVSLEITVGEGRYALSIECAGTQPRPYRLQISAMFPTS